MAGAASEITASGESRVVSYGRAATMALAQAIAGSKQAAGDVFAPVTVVVPSNVAGLSVRRLIGSGRVGGAGGLINVAFVTPYELAATLATPRLDPGAPPQAPLLAA